MRPVLLHPLLYQTRDLARLQSIIAIQCLRCLAVMSFISLKVHPAYSEAIRS